MPTISGSPYRYSGLVHHNRPKLIVIERRREPADAIAHSHEGLGGFGYHYHVSECGELTIGRPESACGILAPRSRAISVCLEGATMSQEQKTTLQHLIADIWRRRGRLELSHPR